MILYLIIAASHGCYILFCVRRPLSSSLSLGIPVSLSTVCVGVFCNLLFEILVSQTPTPISVTSYMFPSVLCTSTHTQHNIDTRRNSTEDHSTSQTAPSATFSIRFLPAFRKSLRREKQGVAERLSCKYSLLLLL